MGRTRGTPGRSGMIGLSKSRRKKKTLKVEEKPEESKEESKEEEEADQVEEVSKEEGSKRDRPETGEVMEELRRRLAHGAAGPPPVCEVRTLGTYDKKRSDELSFQPGSIITVHRISETSLGWIVGTLDGERGYVPTNTIASGISGYVPTNTMASYGSSGGPKRDLLEVIRNDV